MTFYKAKRMVDNYGLCQTCHMKLFSMPKISQMENLSLDRK